MEIYKQKITDLKQGVKNPNRVNAFVDGKFSFSLDISQVVDFKLKVGKLVTPEELLEYQKASEFGKLYQRALEWALLRPRSEKETRDYLWRKLRSSSSDTRRFATPSASKAVRPSLWSSEELAEFSSKIMERLKAHGYVNDVKFAKWYAENRFVKKGVSQKRLKMELMKKGISAEIIAEVLSARDDTEEILKIIAKKRAKYDDEKLIQYLCRQGFSWQLASELVRSSGTD